MSFDRPFSLASIREMEQEFEHLMPTTARIEWRMLGEVNRGETFERVVVSRFEGKCEVQELSGAGFKPGRLATTRAWRDQVLPFPEVDCDAISAMLRPQIDSTNTLRLRLLFGRAMGRVLAHEVYHIELNTPSHSSKGLAKPTFNASDLFAPRFGFAPAEMEQMTDLLGAAP